MNFLKPMKRLGEILMLIRNKDGEISIVDEARGCLFSGTIGAIVDSDKEEYDEFKRKKFVDSIEIIPVKGGGFTTTIQLYPDPCRDIPLEREGTKHIYLQTFLQIIDLKQRVLITEYKSMVRVYDGSVEDLLDAAKEGDMVPSRIFSEPVIWVRTLSIEHKLWLEIYLKDTEEEFQDGNE